MFGASVVRQKRERERKERALRELDPPVIPYIKPFGARFDASQLPYFKYRQADQYIGKYEHKDKHKDKCRKRQRHTSQLLNFKYRQALAELDAEKQRMEVGTTVEQSSSRDSI